MSHTDSSSTRFHVRFVWTMVAAVALLLFGISTATAQGAADDPAQVEAGQAVYEMACAGCHGEDGTGSNFGRPLTDIAAEQPDRSVHVASVTDGKGSMPAFGDQLEADQIDAAISYVRLTFASEAAADAEPEALADTGVETAVFAIAGMALVGAGGLMVTTSRRVARRS